MTDDRASLGARIAEAMGWEGSSSDGIWNPPGEAWLGVFWHSEDLVTWEGYGVVDAWMREQGWCKEVNRGINGRSGVVYTPTTGPLRAYESSDDKEEVAAIQAALKALEARE